MADNGLVDTRSIVKPDKLKATAIWSDWKSQFENYVACVNAVMHQEMSQSELMAEPAIIAADDVPQKQRGATLYAILAAVLEGRDL